MAEDQKPKKVDTRKKSIETGRFKLDMTFGEAIKKAANTPKPKKKAKK